MEGGTRRKSALVDIEGSPHKGNDELRNDDEIDPKKLKRSGVHDTVGAVGTVPGNAPEVVRAEALATAVSQVGLSYRALARTRALRARAERRAPRIALARSRARHAYGTHGRRALPV